MWLYTTFGFFSVVKKDGEADLKWTRQSRQFCSEFKLVPTLQLQLDSAAPVLLLPLTLMLMLRLTLMLMLRLTLPCPLSIWLPACSKA